MCTVVLGETTKQQCAVLWIWNIAAQGEREAREEANKTRFTSEKKEKTRRVNCENINKGNLFFSSNFDAGKQQQY